jgi:hypothetical protein
VRYKHLTTDIPQRFADSTGIQRYAPLQSGYYLKGTHQWHINKYGWPGCLPDSLNNLITVIGDSYIENFMNPEECHQCFLLKQRIPSHNFLETGRSGITFIESMELSRYLDTLSPSYHVIYVNPGDFTESISEIARLQDRMQLSLQEQKILKGHIKGQMLKKVLYNFKFLYYLYLRFPILVKEQDKDVRSTTDESVYIARVKQLLDYITHTYQIDNKIIVFHPGCNREIIQLVKNSGFKTIELDCKNDQSWTLDNDSHWSCYGHTKIAEQVTLVLNHY